MCSFEARAEACGRRIFKISRGLREHCLAEVIDIALTDITLTDEELDVMYEVRYENGREEFPHDTEFVFVEDPSLPSSLAPWPPNLSLP